MRLRLSRLRLRLPRVLESSQLLAERGKDVEAGENVETGTQVARDQPLACRYHAVGTGSGQAEDTGKSEVVDVPKAILKGWEA